MNDLFGTLGIAVLLFVIIGIVVLIALSFLMPFFVFLINSRVRELLEEQRIANNEISTKLTKISEQLDKILPDSKKENLE